MVLIDSHGYITQAGSHSMSLTVVIDGLLLGGQHLKKTATQSHIVINKVVSIHTPVCSTLHDTTNRGHI